MQMLFWRKKKEGQIDEECYSGRGGGILGLTRKITEVPFHLRTKEGKGTNVVGCYMVAI